MSTPTKVCNVCKQEFPLTSEFWCKDRHRLDGFQYRCRSCNKKMANQYTAKTIDARHEKSRQYYEKNRTNILEKNRSWAKDNPDREYARHARWAKDNAAKVRAKVARRRALKLSREGYYTPEQIEALYEFQEGRCFHCDADISNYFERDHWIPLTKGGSNWIENIRLLCRHCNRSKHDKLPWEWDNKYVNESHSSVPPLI